VIGETLAAQGRHDDAIAQLTQAVRITRAAGADQIRARRAELALAREQARDGDANALARLDAIAALPAANADARKVSWQARAYAAEVRCRNAQRDTGRAALDALQTELATALPQGGVLPREVAAMRAKCD